MLSRFAQSVKLSVDRSRRLRALVTHFAITLLLIGCDKDKPRIPGKREFLLDQAVSDKPAVEKSSQSLIKKRPFSFKMPQPVFELSVAGSASRGMLPEPVWDNKNLYVLDGLGSLKCFERRKGKIIWEKQLLQGDALWGGGIALEEGTLYVALSAGDVYAIHALSGKILWKVSLKTPIKSAPAVKNNFLVIMTTELMALNTKDGNTVWKTSIPLEYAAIMGHAKPVIDGDSVFVILPSGEAQACHLSNGQPIWTETLSSDDVIPHARAVPVIDDQEIFVVSYAGNLMKLERRSGKVLWNKALNVTQKPLVYRDVLFVISQGKDLLCVNRSTGHVQWLKALSEDGLWFGPVIIGKYLLLTSQEGILAWHDIQTGDCLERQSFPGSLSYPLFSMDGQFLVMSDEGIIWSMRS